MKLIVGVENLGEKNYCFLEKEIILLRKISRGGAVVARWAHNPKVIRSNRVPATDCGSEHCVF